jgi:hypothetical protein
MFCTVGNIILKIVSMPRKRILLRKTKTRHLVTCLDKRVMRANKESGGGNGNDLLQQPNVMRHRVFFIRTVSHQIVEVIAKSAVAIW